MQLQVVDVEVGPVEGTDDVGEAEVVAGQPDGQRLR